MFEYEEAIANYAKELKNFIEKYELPEGWFVRPDHIAIKCADGEDYVYTLEELLPDAQQTSEADIANRRLAALHLTSPQVVGNWDVEWLELMEPRPEKVGNDVVGFEHMEFYYPDFDEVREVLTQKDVEFKDETNPGHNWINITINETGQELKLNDKTLADIVEHELVEGIARLI